MADSREAEAVSGWLSIALLAAVTLGGLRLLGLRGAMLQLAAAALLFGGAGYALQGRPGLAGSPRHVAAARAPLPLTGARRALMGQFNSADRWITIAEGYASRGDTRSAAGVLGSAVREHPTDAFLWVGYGNALFDHAGALTPAARGAYARALELAPDHPAPHFFYGLALARSGDREGALAQWQGILATAPADASWRPLVEGGISALEPKP
jgi:cytochrome c-type biogenesis protein CcmH/NrfG